MKSMKGLGGVNRMFGSVRRRGTAPASDNSPETTLSTPEENASRSVKLFCESGGPNHTQGDEVLHLPTIVEAAESTPAAAKECAYQVRKALSYTANASRPYVQYNAVMLMRILSDNPGATFTQNIDKKFVETVKDLIRYGKDPSVQQILRETLENFERDKKNDLNLQALLEMWKKEKVKIEKVLGRSGVFAGRSSQPPPAHQNYFSRNHSNRGLPTPEELASRIEEAKTSAKLLAQLVLSTPPTELLENELVREFSDRCRSASRSIQSYMAAENPAPDNDTMLTLIETNDQLSLALSKHQRAVLHARKVTGTGTPAAGPSPSISPVNTGLQQYAAPSGPPPGANVAPPPPPPRKAVPSKQPAVNSPPAQENPFNDQEPIMDRQEPYHPGFNLTRSYMGRQESATNNVTLHGAIPPTPQGEQPGPAPKDQEPQQPVYRY